MIIKNNRNRPLALIAFTLSSALFGCDAEPPQADGPKLGQAMTIEESQQLSITVFPDGSGLPLGGGSAAAGESLYSEKCAGCHGIGGRDGAAKALAGAPSKGVDWSVGTSWPYATSIYDYIRRAMPPHEVKQLSGDEAYSLTAYILYLNDLIEYEERVDRASLPLIKMPAQEYSISKWEDGG